MRSWLFDNETEDSESHSGLNMWGPHPPQSWRRHNPPAIVNSVEVDAGSPVKKFGSFRVANQRIKKVSLKTPLHPDHTYNAVSFNIRVKKNVNKWVFVTGFEALGH